MMDSRWLVAVQRESLDHRKGRSRGYEITRTMRLAMLCYAAMIMDMGSRLTDIKMYVFPYNIER